MKISFIPSLQHLCCTKILPSLFEKVLPYIEISCLHTSRLFKDTSLAYSMGPDRAYKLLYKHISENIKILIRCAPLQKKLQSFIAPLFCEIEDWFRFCESIGPCYDDVLFIILKSISRFWAWNGSIDRENFAKILVKNTDIGPSYRFKLACAFCLLDDVLDIWKVMSDFAIMFRLLPELGLWVRYLESASTKDQQSFNKWAIEREMWKKNVYVMNHVSKTFNVVEQNQWLSYVLNEKDINNDIMYFGFSRITGDEQEFVFKKAPVEVFKCMTSWPMRSNFCNIMDILMPHLTCDTFCDILNMLLFQIKLQKKDCDELILILKKFWAESPLLFKNSACKIDTIFKPLQIVLEYNFTESFPSLKFFDSFYDDTWSLTPFVI